MNDSLNVYIADEKLRKYAELLVESASLATGCKEPVHIMVPDFSVNYGYTGSTYPTLTTTTTTNLLPRGSYTYTIPSSNSVTISSSGVGGGGGNTTTGYGNIPPNGLGGVGTWSTGTVSQPAGQGYGQWYNTPTVPSITLGPVNVAEPPEKKHFEQMVFAQIQMLNEAYLLGREHGKLEGKKEGAEQITKTIDDIMDTEILQEVLPNA